MASTTVNELKRWAKLGTRSQYRVELHINLDDLESNQCTIKHYKLVKLYKDVRSFQDEEGEWHVYPIATSRTQVYIVCPHCGCIHVHGNSLAHGYIGHRGSHCGSPFHPRDENGAYVSTGGYFIEK